MTAPQSPPSPPVSSGQKAPVFPRSVAPAVPAPMRPPQGLVYDALAKAGFSPANLGFLFPVEPFFELSGEDIRSRLFLTTNDQGEELCLRPEFTIPATLVYRQSMPEGARRDWLFSDMVFRHRPGESGEFMQIGIESFGRLDRSAADADIIAETWFALQGALPSLPFTLTLGDMGLFSALLAAMGLEGALARRLGHALGEGRLNRYLDDAQNGKKTRQSGLDRYSGVLDALRGADPAEAQAFVKDLLSMAGMRATGGRSADDIAGRFLERAREDAQVLGDTQIAMLRRYIAIEGHPDVVAANVRAIATEAGFSLNAALDLYEQRTGFLELRGVPLARIRARAGFARAMDYYSGMVFEIRTEALPQPLAAGGRYDRLLERLGRKGPALGAAIWVDRLNAAAKPPAPAQSAPPGPKAPPAAPVQKGVAP